MATDSHAEPHKASTEYDACNLRETRPQIDGEYDIRLIVQDKSGKSNPAIKRVEIDNQSPVVEISQPTNRQLVSDTIEIIGTARDNYLKTYQLDFRAEGTAEWQEIISRHSTQASSGFGREWNPPHGGWGI